MSRRKNRVIKPRSTCDAHHLLWTRSDYSQGYAKALREHEWLRVYIPRDTLHKQIHHEINKIPLPDPKECRKAFELLARYERAGKLSKCDTPITKLDFLISQLKTPTTQEALIREREIFQEVSVMKVTLTLENFPMLLLEMFKQDIAQYVDADIQVGGEDTVFVTFTTDDNTKAQCALIICDRYHFAEGESFESHFLDGDKD